MSSMAWRGPLTVVTGIVLALLLTGWTALDPREPLSFHGDHLLTLGNARSYLDGNGFRWNDRLGFPDQRDAMYHATFYFAQKSIMWLAARPAASPATVVYLFYGVGVALVFGAAYWGLRRVGIARDLAWLGGLAFVVTPYVAIRVALHDMLSMPFSVPLGVVLALRIAQPETVGHTSASERGIDPLPWVLAAIIGASGLYYAFFASFFVMVLAAWSSVTRRTLAPLAHATLVCAAIVAVMLVTGPGLGLLDVVSGRVTLTARQAVEQTMYGLVLSDAAKVLVWWPTLEGVTSAPTGREGDWGEWPGVVLTSAVMVLPLVAIWLMWMGRRVRPTARLTTMVLCGVAVTGGVLFTLRGGPGLWFNEWVTPAIRAQNRVAPYLTYFALICLMGWIDGARHRGGSVARAAWAVGLAGALLASAWPALRFFPAKQRAFLMDGAEQADRQSIERLVRVIGDSGVTTILQLPVVGWPEAPPVRGVNPTRFELPHILTPPGSPVRWSYGLSTRQPEFDSLAALADGHLEQGMAPAAAFAGFDAILIEKAALSDADWRKVVDTLSRNLPAACRLFDDRRRTLFQIGATPRLAPCATEPSDRRRYVTAAGRFGRFLLRAGWAGPEIDRVWTDGPHARLIVPLEGRARTNAVDVRITFGLYRPDASRRKDITLVVNAQERDTVTILPGEPLPPSITRTLRIMPDPGAHDRAVIDITIADPERPSDHGGSDHRWLGLALFELDVVSPSESDLRPGTGD